MIKFNDVFDTQPKTKEHLGYGSTAAEIWDTTNPGSRYALLPVSYRMENYTDWYKRFKHLPEHLQHAVETTLQVRGRIRNPKL